MQNGMREESEEWNGVAGKGRKGVDAEWNGRGKGRKEMV